MILGTDWKFRDDMKEDTVPIELLMEPYKGVILRYTRVSINEQADGTARLRFDYELHDPGEHTMIKLRKDEKFNQALGLILNAMILDIADAESKENESRTDNSEEYSEE